MIDSLDPDGRRTVPTTVLSDREGRLWIGNTCGGISQFDGRKFKGYAEKDGLTNSCVYALAEDAHGNLWIGTWGGGLFEFSQNRFTQYASAQGLADNVVRAIAASKDGSIWVATDDGLSHLQNGKFHNFTKVEGLSSNRVNNVFQDRQGEIWAATSGGINLLSGDRFVAVSSTPKILDNDHTGFMEDSSGSLFALSAPKGISRITNDSLLTIDPNVEFASMVEAPGKDFWFAGSNGIFRLPADEIDGERHGRETPLDFEQFGYADGLTSPQSSGGVPNATITPDGKLWVATTQGLAVVDLAKLRRTNERAAPYLDSVTIGSTKQPARSKLTLPPGTHHVELHFDSIELASPEKTRFQYRFDGVDSSWLDADTSQAAVYTSIPIGSHVFHVRACNKDGIWDAEGIAYQVTQQAFFYETIWFRFGIVGALALLLISAYRLRLRQMAHQYNLLLDERVSERTRIARGLHDTLLQSFHGLMLRFQSVQNMLPEGHAKESLQLAIDRAAEAITEGREAVQELRRASGSSDDLVHSLTSLGQELGAEDIDREKQATPVAFRVLVEGEPQRVHAVLYDDLCRIASEALRNAFRHAHANRIEVDIRYDHRMLRLRIRDDGVGMDPKLLTPVGRDGHWGLPGMRERATRIGGHFEVWSQINRGTEVEVTIPGGIAYSESADQPHSRRNGGVK
jgi:signal transduction histidine kinase/streptogramin lyase